MLIMLPYTTPLSSVRSITQPTITQSTTTHPTTAVGTTTNWTATSVTSDLQTTLFLLDRASFVPRATRKSLAVELIGTLSPEAYRCKLCIARDRECYRLLKHLDPESDWQCGCCIEHREKCTIVRVVLGEKVELVTSGKNRAAKLDAYLTTSYEKDATVVAVGEKVGVVGRIVDIFNQYNLSVPVEKDGTLITPLTLLESLADHHHDKPSHLPHHKPDLPYPHHHPNPSTNPHPLFSPSFRPAVPDITVFAQTRMQAGEAIKMTEKGQAYVSMSASKDEVGGVGRGEKRKGGKKEGKDVKTGTKKKRIKLVKGDEVVYLGESLKSTKKEMSPQPKSSTSQFSNTVRGKLDLSSPHAIAKLFIRMRNDCFDKIADLAAAESSSSPLLENSGCEVAVPVFVVASKPKRPSPLGLFVPYGREARMEDSGFVGSADGTMRFREDGGITSDGMIGSLKENIGRPGVSPSSASEQSGYTSSRSSSPEITTTTWTTKPALTFSYGPSAYRLPSEQTYPQPSDATARANSCTSDRTDYSSLEILSHAVCVMAPGPPTKSMQEWDLVDSCSPPLDVTALDLLTDAIDLVAPGPPSKTVEEWDAVDVDVEGQAGEITDSGTGTSFIELLLRAAEYVDEGREGGEEEGGDQSFGFAATSV